MSPNPFISPKRYSYLIKPFFSSPNFLSPVLLKILFNPTIDHFIMPKQPFLGKMISFGDEAIFFWRLKNLGPLLIKNSKRESWLLIKKPHSLQQLINAFNLGVFLFDIDSAIFHIWNGNKNSAKVSLAHP